MTSHPFAPGDIAQAHLGGSYRHVIVLESSANDIGSVCIRRVSDGEPLLRLSAHLRACESGDGCCDPREHEALTVALSVGKQLGGVAPASLVPASVANRIDVLETWIQDLARVLGEIVNEAPQDQRSYGFVVRKGPILAARALLKTLMTGSELSERVKTGLSGGEYGELSRMRTWRDKLLQLANIILDDGASAESPQIAAEEAFVKRFQQLLASDREVFATLARALGLSPSFADPLPPRKRILEQAVTAIKDRGVWQRRFTEATEQRKELDAKAARDRALGEWIYRELRLTDQADLAHGTRAMMHTLEQAESFRRAAAELRCVKLASGKLAKQIAEMCQSEDVWTTPKIAAPQPGPSATQQEPYDRKDY